MKITGIIAEYDPFHNGHAYHIAKTRAQTGAKGIVTVLVQILESNGYWAIFIKSLVAFRYFRLTGITNIQSQIPDYRIHQCNRL